MSNPFKYLLINLIIKMRERMIGNLYKSNMMFMCLCLCMWLKISLTSGLTWFSFVAKLLIYRGNEKYRVDYTPLPQEASRGLVAGWLYTEIAWSSLATLLMILLILVNVFNFWKFCFIVETSFDNNNIGWYNIIRLG